MRAIKSELLKLHESRRERPIYALCVLTIVVSFLCLFAWPAVCVTSDETEIFKRIRFVMRDAGGLRSVSLKHHRTILEHDKILIIQHGG